jgi:hypothetical protein
LDIGFIKTTTTKKGKDEFPTAEVIAVRASYLVALPSGKDKSHYLLQPLM